MIKHLTFLRLGLYSPPKPRHPMTRNVLFAFLIAPLFMACGSGNTPESTTTTDSTATVVPDSLFEWEADQFADIRILRYRVPGWDLLSLKQKQMCYYLNMAGLAGRDIMYDQNYKHNLKIRRALEAVIKNYKGDKTTADWTNFMTYAKQVFFSSGIEGERIKPFK